MNRDTPHLGGQQDDSQFVSAVCFCVCSYFELESSGVREEIRYHYRFNGKPRSESFPYRLADGQWHKIALTISATHLLLHVDCNR